MAWGARFLVQQQNVKGCAVFTPASASTLERAMTLARKLNAERHTSYGANPRFAVIECKVVAEWKDGKEVGS